MGQGLGHDKKRASQFVKLCSVGLPGLEPGKAGPESNKIMDKLEKEKNNLVDAIVLGLQEKKGKNIVVVDLTEIPDTICGYFVIATGGSPSQIQALARSVGDKSLELAHQKPLAMD